MLTRIGATLTSWTPRQAGGDALSVVRAGWMSLVGPDVARAAQPVAIVDETLIVVTASSAWSHQLAFLEPQILRGLREVRPAAGIARLRFRVGTPRAGTRSGRPPSGGGGPRHAAASGPARPAPATAHEAFLRYRATVDRARSAHAARGGTFCRTCAAPIARGERCVPCAQWAHAEVEARCQRLLFDAPWLSPEDVLETLPELEAAAYDGIRRQLLRGWWDEMILARKRAALPRPIAPDRARLRKIASSYVLLETKLDPNRLEMDSPVRRNALGALYDFIRDVERGAERA